VVYSVVISVVVLSCAGVGLETAAAGEELDTTGDAVPLGVAVVAVVLPTLAAEMTVLELALAMVEVYTEVIVEYVM